MRIVRWMCHATLRADPVRVELQRRTRIECVSKMMRTGRLRWFEHVERTDKKFFFLYEYMVRRLDMSYKN